MWLAKNIQFCFRQDGWISSWHLVKNICTCCNKHGRKYTVLFWQRWLEIFVTPHSLKISNLVPGVLFKTSSIISSMMSSEPHLCRNVWNWVNWKTWIKFDITQMWHNDTVQLSFWFLCQFNSKINKWTHSEDVWQQKLMMFYLQHKKGELWVNQTNLMRKKGTMCRKKMYTQRPEIRHNERRDGMIVCFVFFAFGGNLVTCRQKENMRS